MIASNLGSNNNDPETIPITNPTRSQPSVVRRITNLFRGGGQRNNDDLRQEGEGYVEFGGMSNASNQANSNEHGARTLGTFAGCFAPVSLSMFSALVFIRVGFLVGNAGLYVTLLQFAIAYLILVFTVCSVCAISTNGAIQGGGVYFMISRTLGAEFGGAIGTLFFIANVVGCGLAITGCVEGLLQNFGANGYLLPKGSEGFLEEGRWFRFCYCSLINTLILLVVLIGAEMFAKTSAFILGIVVVCLFSTYISFLTQGEHKVDIPIENTLLNRTEYPFLNYTGLSMQTFTENLFPNYGQDYTSDGQMVNFAIVFGVLFSGVTGIMAGANMSGELKNPSKSIPRGTLSAVLFTFCCYIALSVLIAATSPSVLLRNNFLFLMPINIIPAFVAVGILTATFSTALSNLIGSSRVLEALAKDQVFGYLLNYIIRGTTSGGNPVAAVFTSWALVELILLIGSLNTIAQINSVLFMLSYMATNLACLGIEITGAINFRPTFKYFTWHTAFVGLVGTVIMMFVINPIYASVSVILCLILVIALHLFSPAAQGAQWGSISQALMFHQVRKYLLMLDSRKDHVKYWRPQMLLLVSSPRSCCPLIHFVNDMKKGGLYVIGHVKVGEFKDNEIDPTVEEYTQWLSLIDHMKVKAFVELTLSKTVREGVQQLTRISGMGAMKPNTIILGYYDEEACVDFFDDDNSPYRTNKFTTSNTGVLFPYRKKNEIKSLSPEEYISIVSDILRMKKNVCLCRHFHRLNKTTIATSNHIKYIDLWPINIFDPTNEDPFDMASQFMMQLACIINMLPVWKNLQLRVFLCETGDNEQQPFERPAEYRLNQLLNQLRIPATIHQIPEWKNSSETPRNRTLLRNLTRNSETDASPMTEENMNRMKLYMQRINQMIRDHSNSTAVTFMYLPPPPNISMNFRAKCVNYLDLLSELTYDLPPTILVHGLSTVTNTSL